jgi:cellulose synthase/poly-beta-1,6-N-acetylglucosamine synthase-like glycosyltransferase
LLAWENIILNPADTPMPSHIDFNKVDFTTLLSNHTVQRLLDIAEEHPEWPTARMVDHLKTKSQGNQPLTIEQARIILRRLNLSTVQRRKLRNHVRKGWEECDANDRTQPDLIWNMIPDIRSYLHHRKAYRQSQQVAVSPASPAPVLTAGQQETVRWFDKFFSLTKQFGLLSIASFLFFFSGSLVFDVIFRAVTLIAKIGMFFAFLSLACGILFFLYSIKYYLSIALVLSFSNVEQKDSKRLGVGGFLQSLFGISVEVPVEKGVQKVSPRLGLSYSTVVEAVLERYPFVSLHVGTYNEKRVIDRFLLAATSMNYENYEVIVADDSTDETVQLLEQWKAHPKVKISHRDTRAGYKGAALAEALKQVDPRTEFLLIFDADFIPYPDTITQFLNYFQAVMGDLHPETIKMSQIAAVQGYQWHILNKSENWITRGIRSEYAGSYVVERTGTERYLGLEQISGSVYMIRRDALEHVGWGTSITEDFELTLKLYEQGYKVVYTPYIQAPAEAASTIKRLIRQRMRWAEGHSFNVKKMFSRLLTSPNLTAAEKFEFVYLAPYYLQAFFFLLGALSWFLAEIVFQTHLPFWTETWGWSLVCTNLFALPLMNFVGLFMETAQERDYIGLLSFIVLSYLVAPFQAFAAVKGFLEKEEGPWMRTPKTGRITDSFVPGRVYRFVQQVLGKQQTTPAFTQSNRLVPNPLFALNYHPSPSSIQEKRMRWVGKTVLSLLLMITFTLYLMPSTALLQRAHATISGTGNGADGAITISSTTNCQTTAIASGRTQPDCFMTYVNGTSNSGQTTLNVNSTTGIASGDEILITGILGTQQGNYEIQSVSSVTSSTITVGANLANTYTFTSGSQETMVVRVPQYTNVTINSGGTLTVSAYSSSSHVGGVLALMATGTLTVNTGGTIKLDGLGFAGGSSPTGGAGSAGSSGITTSNGGSAVAGNNGSGPGDGTGGGAGGNPGNGATINTGPDGGGGAGGTGGGGGGGAYGAAGSGGGAGTSGTGGGGGNANTSGGSGSAGSAGGAGSSYGLASLSKMYFGSGGGSGASGAGGAGGASGGGTGANGGNGGNGGAGGTGGGIGYISVETFIMSGTGTISSAGSAGRNGNSGSAGSNASSSDGGGGGGAPGSPGGGGAGGSLYLRGDTVTLGSNLITASGGGAGSTTGVTGGKGGSNGFAGNSTASNGGGGGGAYSASTGGNGSGGGVGSAGAGSVGRIHLDYGTSFSGTTSPTIDTTQLPEHLLFFAPIVLLLPTLVSLLQKWQEKKQAQTSYAVEQAWLPKRKKRYRRRKKKPPG